MSYSSKSGIFANSATYIVSNLILKAFNFLLLPLYTAYLTTKEYGMICLVIKFQGVASYIVAGCLTAAAIRFYADYKDSNEKVGRFFGTLICFVSLSGILFVSICIIFKRPLINIVFKGMDFSPTILMSLVALIFITLVSMYQAMMTAMQNSKQVAVISISYFFIQLSLNIYFITILKLGANGVILSSIISNLSISLYMLIYMIRNNIFTFCIDRILLKDSLKYSLPLLPHNVSLSASSLISNVFINQFASLSSVGLFNLASQFGQVSEMAQSSTNSAFQPWFYDRMNQKKEGYEGNIRSTASILIWFYGFVMLGIGLFSHEAILLFCNNTYYQAWTVIPLILLVYILNIPYFFYANILFYYKQATKYVFIATFPTSIINVILSYFLIQRFDMYGSVVADIIHVILKISVIIYISGKYNPVGYKLIDFIKKIIMLIVLLAIGIIPSFIYFPYKVSAINFIYKFTIMVVYLFIVFIFGKEDFKELNVKIFNRKKHQVSAGNR